MIAWWWIPLSYFIALGVFMTVMVVGAAVHQFRARRKFDKGLTRIINVHNEVGQDPREQM